MQFKLWARHTRGAYREVWLEGVGHNDVVLGAPEPLMQRIRADLAPAR